MLRPQGPRLQVGRPACRDADHAQPARLQPQNSPGRKSTAPRTDQAARHSSRKPQATSQARTTPRPPEQATRAQPARAQAARNDKAPRSQGAHCQLAATPPRSSHHPPGGPGTEPVPLHLRYSHHTTQRPRTPRGCGSTPDGIHHTHPSASRQHTPPSTSKATPAKPAGPTTTLHMLEAAEHTPTSHGAYYGGAVIGR